MSSSTGILRRSGSAGRCSQIVAAAALGAGLALPLTANAIIPAQPVPEPASPAPEILSNVNDLNVVEIEPGTGEVWGGGDGGVVRYDPASGKHTKYTVADGLIDNMVGAIGFDRAGNRWFGTYSGISRLAADDTWTRFPDPWGARDPEDLRPITAILEQSDDSLLFALGPRGIGLRRPDGTFTRFTTPPAAGRLDRVEGLALGPEGELWIGGMPDFVLVIRPDGSWRPHEGVHFDRVRNFGFDRYGNVWMAGARGIVRLDSEGRIFHYTPDTTQGKLPFTDAADVAVDAEGGVWITERVAALSPGHGAVVFYPLSDDWITWSREVYTATRGVSDPRVVGVAVAPGGDVWAGARRAGLLHLQAGPALDGDPAPRYQAARFEGHPAPDWAGSSRIWDLAFDNDATLWVAGWDVLSHRDGTGQWQHYRDELPHASPRHLAFDTRGGMWVATRRGLGYRDAAGVWRSFTRESTGGALPSDDMWWVAVAPDGTVWVPTLAGLAELDSDGNGRAVHTNASTNGAFGSNNIWALAFEDDGTVWAGTAAGAAWRAPNGSWFRSSRLGRAFVHNIVRDPWSDLWFGLFGTGGAHRLTLQGWEHYGVGGGLLEESVQDLAFEPSGAVWMATRAGMSRLAEDGSWSHIGPPQGLPNAYGQSLAVDSASGDVWLGTLGGLQRLPGGALPLCARAEVGPINRTAEAQLDRADDIDLYRLSVSEPYTRIDVAITDPADAVEAWLVRDCNRISIGSGRHISIGSGRHIGGQREGSVDIGAATGTYYLVVRPREGLSEAALPVSYTLALSLAPPDNAEVRTLVLTDGARLAALHAVPTDGEVMQVWREALDLLVRHHGVRGRIVDLGEVDDHALKAAYQAWTSQANDPVTANRLAEALHSWLNDQRLATPSLRYLVIAGDDRVIPFARVSVFPVDGPVGDWSRESDYLADSGIPPASALGQALAADTTLSDDVYGASTAILWRAGQQLYVPELAVGRLIERPEDMTRTIQRFLDADGRLDVDSAVVAGWHFMEDGARRVAQSLSGTRAAPGPEDLFLGGGWSTTAFGRRLSQGALGLLFTAMHADHRQLEGPDRNKLGTSDLWLAPDGVGVVFGLACHAGLNVPNTRTADAPPDDLAELWARRAAVTVASSGWAYGMDGHLGYQERLMADFADQLFTGDGTAVGDALVRAKQGYFAQHLLNHYHVKTLAGTVFYGLPMYRVGIEPAVASQSTAPTRSSAATAHAEAPDPSAGRTRLGGQREVRIAQTGPDPRIRLRVTWELQPGELTLRTTENGRYYTFFGGLPHAESGQAVQPMRLDRLVAQDLDGRELAPRGVVIESATYTEEPFEDPLVVRAGPLGRPQPAVAAEDPAALDGWLPGAFVSFQRLDFRRPGQGTLSEMQLRFSMGQYNFASLSQRLYRTLEISEYYGASSDTTPPQVLSVAVATDERGQHYAVRAYDEAGIERIVLACDDRHTEWTTIDLTTPPGSTDWSGTVHTGHHCIVQAVDKHGNVAIDDNHGHYYPRSPLPTRTFLPALHNGF